MATLAELMVQVGADISEFSRGMQRVQDDMQSVGSKMQSAGKKMTDVGKKMGTTVTLPLLALGGLAVKTGATFDAQMSKVSAVSGATGKDFEKLRDQAKELGKTTVWSATEAGEGMEFLARAGWKTDEIMSAMPNVLNLATASAIDLGTASDIASNIVSGFGDSAKNSQRYIDVLAKATANSNTDMIQLGDAMKYVAPVAHTFGWSLEETTTAIGKMSDAGIQGSQAGTALRGGLLRLAKPSKEARDLMDDLGISMFDAEGKMKSMPDVIKELEGGLAGMSDKQQAHAMATLFGQEAVSGWLALMEVGSDELKDFTGDMENAEGTAQNMADTMNDNLQGSFKNLSSALEGVAISLYEKLEPSLRKATDWLTDLVTKFGEIDPKVQGAIVAIGAIVAGFAPFLSVLGYGVQGIGFLMTALGAISTPVLIVIGAIALLAGAFYLLWQKSETFREGVTNVFNAVKDVVMKAVGAVTEFIGEKVEQIKQFWTENGEQILQAVENVWNFILGVFEFIMPAIQFVIEYVWNSIKGIIDGALNFILGLVKTFSGLFTGDFKGMWEGIKQMFKGAIEFVWNLMNLSFVGGIRKLIVNLAKGALKLIRGLWDDIVLRFMLGKDKAVKLVTNLKDTAMNIFNGLKGTVKTVWDGIKSAITKPIETAKTTVLGIIDKIVGAFAKMKIKIPKPKLPKVSVAMAKGVMGIPYPKFDVQWNAKGGIFTGATLLGGGQGVGEAGAEAVLPIQHKRYMRPFAQAVADHLPFDNEARAITVENVVHTTIELDGEVVGRKIERYVTQEQDKNFRRNNRASGLRK